MGLRFRKSFKIAPGVKLNVGKRSTGISFGGKHGGISFNSKSGTRVRGSIPGTGISYSSKIGSKSRKKKSTSHKTTKYMAPTPRNSNNATESDPRTGALVIAGCILVAGISCLATNIILGFVLSAAGAIILLYIFKKEKDEIKEIEQSIKENEEISGISLQDEPPVIPSPVVSPEPPAKKELVKENFTVAGVSYYKENIMKLACANPDWRKHAKTLLAENKHTVYRYNFIYKPVKLIPEPENEHDPNAILVQIAGEKVGCIGREENIHVKDILENRSVKYISAFVSGGDYKMISDAGLMEKDSQEIGINIRIAYS